MRLLLLLALLFSVPVFAQTASVETKFTITPGPVTADAPAAKSYQVFASTSTFAADAVLAPVTTVLAPALTGSFTMQVPNGATIYVRANACGDGGCTVLSPLSTRTVKISLPSVPVGVQVTVTVTVSGP